MLCDEFSFLLIGFFIGLVVGFSCELFDWLTYGGFPCGNCTWEPVLGCLTAYTIEVVTEEWLIGFSKCTFLIGFAFDDIIKLL